ASAAPTDKVTLGAQPTQPVNPTLYANPRTASMGASASTPMTGVELSTMLEESNRKANEIIDLLMGLLGQQGLNIAKVASGEQSLQADPATITKAQAAIAEDGEFGVKQVSERILSFAQGAIAGDPSKLASIRAGVEKGFSQARDILGGTLPAISQRTYDTIMASFDRWASDGIPSGVVSLASTEVK
ncbi:MAG: DUF5610 domain-containing protein, partial [Herbaspirillum sp.]